MSAPVTDLVEWLTAALDDAEAIARNGAEWHTHFCGIDESAFHEAFDPAAVLRTIAAHRAILARHAPQESDPNGCDRCSDVCGDYVASSPCPDVLTLAAIYESRPGYLEEWKL